MIFLPSGMHLPSQDGAFFFGWQAPWASPRLTPCRWSSLQVVFQILRLMGHQAIRGIDGGLEDSSVRPGSNRGTFERDVRV